jgi:hypothetical protein
MDMEGKKRFPLREAYAFAAENGMGEQVDEIRDMEIEWDRGYTSSVRRGRLIRLFDARDLMTQFIARHWPFGSTPLGEAERRRCLRIGDDYDGFLSGKLPDERAENDMIESESLEFALEAHLRDFLAKNLGHIEPGLRLYQAEGKSGVEFSIDGGRIDILAIDASGRYVVIELKLSHGRNKALGQLLYYMGWVDSNLGNGPCRGIIIANDIAEELAIAVSRVSGVTLHRYKMNFSVERAGASTA